MKNKIAIFEGGVSPLAHGLPSNIAASIGRTLVRHTYMESLQRAAVNLLLEISIKQGRVAVRLPQAKAYPKLIQTLLQFHGHYSNVIKFKNLALALDAADNARNILAHSLIMKDPKIGKYRIQIVRGSWELDQDVFSVSRALQPETPILDRAFLKARRAEVEAGIKLAKQLLKLVAVTMRALNEKRCTQAAWDRRRPLQNQNIPQAQRRSSPA